MSSALLGLSVGAVFGVLLSRGGICFNAGIRTAVDGNRWTILRVFGIAVGIQVLALPILIALGVDVTRIGLYPAAQVVGGLVFGGGMALAGGCIAGILWKSGAGSIATAIAIAGFVIGELLARGGLSGTVADLNSATSPSRQTVYGLLGLPYAVVAVPAGVLLLALILGWTGGGLREGLALGAVSAFAWVAAGWADYGYGLGFVGAPTNARGAIESGDIGALSFEFYLALGVIAGAAVAIRGPLRMPDRARASRALGGGVLMGIGGTLAHGCNIGNGLTGVPLLSVGSLLAIAAMAVGAALTWRLLLSPRPRLRGHERPEAAW